jgi:phospholipase/lecithinase/hemolysin
MNRTLVTCVLSLLLAPNVAIAAPITTLYVVGDSLSDAGNAYVLTGGTFPPPPYAQRASNGPVAVERLADTLGITLTPSEAGGTNYAVLGATTGLVTIAGTSPPVQTENLAAIQYGQAALAGTSLQSQALALLGDGLVADPASSLVLVWGGANDFFLNPSLATASTGVGNILDVVTTLYAGGARNFLVPNLPDLSLTPAGRTLPAAQQAGLQALTIGFNTGLRSALDSASSLPGVDITQFDTFAFFNRLLADPGAFGFSDAITPCLTGNLANGGVVCGDPSAHIFWDTVHPTTAAHRALGDAFAAAVVPEPTSLTLAVVGAGVWLMRYRRRGVTASEQPGACHLS